MSEGPMIFGNLPEGRRLETDDPGRPANHWGTISRFARATPERIRAARKALHEIPTSVSTAHRFPGEIARRAEPTSPCADTST